MTSDRAKHEGKRMDLAAAYLVLCGCTEPKLHPLLEFGYSKEEQGGLNAESKQFGAA